MSPALWTLCVRSRISASPVVRRAVQPGSTRVVVSACSMIAGPGTTVVAVKASRCQIAAGTVGDVIWTDTDTGFTQFAVAGAELVAGVGVEGPAGDGLRRNDAGDLQSALGRAGRGGRRLQTSGTCGERLRARGGFEGGKFAFRAGDALMQRSQLGVGGGTLLQTGMDIANLGQQGYQNLLSAFQPAASPALRTVSP